MGGSCVELNLNEIKTLQTLFEKAALSSEEKEQLLTNLAVEVEQQTLVRFETKLDPEEKKWEAIADSTRKYLDKYFPQAKPPLLRTGELRDSVESQLKNSEAILIGSAKEYASYIQDGTKKMPARQIFGLGKGDYPELIKIANDFLAERLT